MRPHSTSEQVQKAIQEVKDGSRIFIQAPDARAIVSWYVEPDRTPYCLQFAQGRTVSTKGLLLEFVGEVQAMWEQDVSDHEAMLFALAFIAMRTGLTPTIEEHE